MQGDVRFNYTAHPLSSGGFYISICTEKSFPISSAKNLKLAGLRPSQSNKPQSRNSATAFSPKSNSNEHVALGGSKKPNRQFVDDLVISAVLAASNPITVGEWLRTDERDAQKDDISLGSLILRSVPFGWPVNARISYEVEGEQFEVVYRRVRTGHSNEESASLSAEDAAMIARVFLLAKISAARYEMRTTLADMASCRHRLEDASNILKRGISGIEKKNANKNLEKLLCDLQARENHRHTHTNKLSLRIRFEHFCAPYVTQFQNAMSAHKTVVMVATCLSVMLALVWAWWPYLFGYNHVGFSIIGWWLFLVGVTGGLVLLVSALNLKSLPIRIEELVNGGTIERLNSTLVSLVQTNANVAAINVVPVPREGLPSELLLHEMDKTLHLKERLVSIEGVIKARESHLISNLRHLEEHRDRVRRNIIAAGSGVFVGFFTYEVGESIMEYLHVSHRQDAKAMLYWLIKSDLKRPQVESSMIVNNISTNSLSYQIDPAKFDRNHWKSASNGRTKASGNAADAVKSDTSQSISPRLSSLQPLKAQAGSTSAGTSTPLEVADKPTFDRIFLDEFHRPELFAQSCLLTATIIISVLAAWITVRKPSAEKLSGHGHH